MSASDKVVFEDVPLPSRRKKRKESFLLRLYVAGVTARSTQAILDARKICEDHLAGDYALEVIDIYQQPALAIEEQIVAVPTLIRHHPKPLRRLVGDLSNSRRVLAGLELPVR